jgi:hypothetical protein
MQTKKLRTDARIASQLNASHLNAFHELLEVTIDDLVIDVSAILLAGEKTETL